MVSECFSRASGGDPDFAETLGTSKVFPRASGGGSLLANRQMTHAAAFPAPAGVIPGRWHTPPSKPRPPRASGGKPTEGATNGE